MITDRIEQLRSKMRKENIDLYIIPTSDYHDSEYVSEFFMVRKYFSGFSGSAGTLVVSQNKAALFTDGRYFIQAKEELLGSGIELMKMGEPGVPSLTEYIKKELPAHGVLAFDGRVIEAQQGMNYACLVREKKGTIECTKDPADEIWMDRPERIHHPQFPLELVYAGESVEDKLLRVRNRMQEENAQVHILTSLDDIAWLLNLRGNDVENCPVFFSYLVITQEETVLFAQNCSESLRKEHGIQVLPYDSFYDYCSQLHGQRVLCSEKRINYRLYQILEEQDTLIDRENPTTEMKAVKNATEQENLREAHRKDAIAMVKFLCWLKKTIGKETITEVTAADKLEGFRREQEHFIELSFDTICAYGANGAIIHYSAKEESCSELKPEGMVMIDSGGHFLEGSTDITRTIVLGKLTEEMKKHYTLVLCAMLRLRAARFLYGCSGANLDILARQALWQEGMDYKHGTGHGVGYLLSVHEGPNAFRYAVTPDRPMSAVLEEGMVTTDEPGIYIEGSHGIRIENELLCRKGEKNAYGQFMYFEDLTFVPIDKEAIDLSYMEKQDIEHLNQYHEMVYQKLSPYLEGEELQYLKEATKAL